ncbi:MAG: hypothetical protein AVDCRST_MAG38-2571, partial [uncultured Solirubrobacteraceae bacterium]
GTRRAARAAGRAGVPAGAAGGLPRGRPVDRLLRRLPVHGRAARDPALGGRPGPRGVLVPASPARRRRRAHDDLGGPREPRLSPAGDGVARDGAHRRPARAPGLGHDAAPRPRPRCGGGDVEGL